MEEGSWIYKLEKIHRYGYIIAIIGAGVYINYKLIVFSLSELRPSAEVVEDSVLLVAVLLVFLLLNRIGNGQVIHFFIHNSVQLDARDFFQVLDLLHRSNREIVWIHLNIDFALLFGLFRHWGDIAKVFWLGYRVALCLRELIYIKVLQNLHCLALSIRKLQA